MGSASRSRRVIISVSSRTETLLDRRGDGMLSAIAARPFSWPLLQGGRQPTPVGTRILGPKGAFKNRTSAYRTLTGMEATPPLRKGQGTIFSYGHSNPDAGIVSRVFEAV